MPAVAIYVSDLAKAQAAAVALGFAPGELRLGQLISLGSPGAEADARTLSNRGLAAKTLANDDPEFRPDREWNETTQVLDTVTPPKGRVARTVFLNRFTAAEREDFFAIKRTATGAVLKRVEAFIEYLSLADKIDLDDQYIIDSVTGLEHPSVAVLAAGRAAEILA